MPFKCPPPAIAHGWVLRTTLPLLPQMVLIKVQGWRKKNFFQENVLMWQLDVFKYTSFLWFKAKQLPGDNFYSSKVLSYMIQHLFECIAWISHVFVAVTVSVWSKGTKNGFIALFLSMSSQLQSSLTVITPLTPTAPPY